MTPAEFRLDAPELVAIIKANEFKVFHNTEGAYFVCHAIFSHLDEGKFPDGLDSHPNCEMRSKMCVLNSPITAPIHLMHNHTKDDGASDEAQEFATVWEWLVAISKLQADPARMLPVSNVRYRARMWFAQRYLISGKVCR